MKILLDTHVWLWALGEPERFSRGGRARLRASENVFYLSTASTWEIAVKLASGKLRLPGPPIDYLRERIADTPAIPLPIQHGHALRLAGLPLHHRDPFDRMLIAQAQAEGLAIMTADPAFASYEVDVVGA
jgi:PIN domain nuclease of toxin-antitoxin system